MEQVLLYEIFHFEHPRVWICFQRRMGYDSTSTIMCDNLNHLIPAKYQFMLTVSKDVINTCFWNNYWKKTVNFENGFLIFPFSFINKLKLDKILGFLFKNIAVNLIRKTNDLCDWWWNIFQTKTFRFLFHTSLYF